MRVLNTEILEVEKIIMGINELHNEFSKRWIKNKPRTYNLKKQQVRHICFNEDEKLNVEAKLDLDFINYMNEYCDMLNEVYFHPFYDYLDSNLMVTSRIKEPDSRISKIFHYKSKKNEHGMVNINKCLNDLLGFRVMVEEFEHSAKMVTELEEKLAYLNVKVHNSSKDEYNATHIYFYNGNNKNFPWELQIWRKCDRELNIISHSIHKQGYTKWPSIYNGEFEGVDYGV